MVITQTFTVPAKWVGASIGGNGVKSQDLREFMVAAQRAVVTQLQQPDIELSGWTLKVKWVVHVDGEMFDWNPQLGLPKGATEVSIVATLT